MATSSGLYFRIFDEHIKVTAIVKDPRVGEFELRRSLPTPRVFLNELRVGKRRLRVLVETLHIGMGGRRIKIVVAFLNVFAVITLGPGARKAAP